ncbi:MAG: hypothetical protein ACKO0Z_07100 [Betaproteobacteria bacterium]
MSSPTPFLDAFDKYGSVRKAAAALDMKRSTFFDNLNREREAIKAIQHAEEPFIDPVRSSTRPRYYIFTAAVKGAAVHGDFFDNLKAYAKHLGAELVIGPLTSLGRQRFASFDAKEFDPEIVPFLSDEPIVIGDKIRFCPELNLTPTMVKPLQGLQTYTKKLWGIFPHTKISLETVATHKDRPTKFIATTGAVTHPHYTPTKAGFRAHFDHVHGAVVVEVTKKGVWFRHLTPKSELDGTFYDLGYIVKGGKVDWHDGVDAVIYGDIHAEKIDRNVELATWGSPMASDSFTPLVDHLKPKTQVFHDLMDMTAANYHELNDTFKRFQRYVNKQSSVEEDFYTALDFLSYATTKAPNNIVVDSNHEYFIRKWLLNFDPAKHEDFENIELFYKLKVAVLADIRGENHSCASPDGYSFIELLLKTVAAMNESYHFKPSDAKMLDKVHFLRADESYEIHNVECGWHGHAGPNGRRGSKHAFKFVTEKSTIAHLHSPSIESGCHVVGTSTQLDLGYNQGPSSWAHTHGIIYPHGGRTLITMSDGKFWATQGDVEEKY